MANYRVYNIRKSKVCFSRHIAILLDAFAMLETLLAPTKLGKRKAT